MIRSDLCRGRGSGSLVVVSPGGFVGALAVFLWRSLPMSAALVLCGLSASAETGTPEAVSAQPAAAASADSDVEDQKPLDILEFVVDGNTVLNSEDIESAVYDFLGEGRTVGDVKKARDALEQVYGGHGYPAVQVTIPPQAATNGIIHLQVQENPIGRLRVVNSEYHSISEIKEQVPSLAEGQVLNSAAAQNDLIALNQGGVIAKPELKPGIAPGTVDMDLQVTDHPPWHATVELDDYANQGTSPLRTTTTLSYDNLWQLGHTVSMSYEIAPENPADSRVFSGSYLAHVPDTPLSLLLYGVRSDSNVAAVSGTNVVGKGNIVGVRGLISLPGSASTFQSVTVGVDRKDLAENVVTAGTPSQAPLTYYPISLAYALTLIEDDVTTQGDASVNFVVPGLSSPSSNFDNKRYQGLSSYIYLKGDLSRTQPLPWWGLIAYGKVQGQITGDALISSEQFNAGGADSVRGYYEAERLGDYGAAGTVELRTPSIGKDISSDVNDWHFLAFADAAELGLRQPLPGQQSWFRLASMGIGTRLKIFDMLNGTLDLAVPAFDGSATRAWTLHPRFKIWSEF